jgi:hypothetical protein
MLIVQSQAGNFMVLMTDLRRANVELQAGLSLDVSSFELTQQTTPQPNNTLRENSELLTHTTQQQ